MNKIILSGNICKDIELKYTNNNVAVVQNSIAVKNNYKSANGEYESQFFNFVVWRQTAEFLEKYAAKGSKILIEGNLRNRTYDKSDGTKGYITEVVVEKAELLGTAKKAQDDVTPAEKKALSDSTFEEFGREIEVNENDLPF